METALPSRHYNLTVSECGVSNGVLCSLERSVSFTKVKFYLLGSLYHLFSRANRESTKRFISS